MSRILYTQSGEKITIADQRFAKGGEAEIYEVISTPNYSNHCAKIYKSSYQNKSREAKLTYMLHNPPKTSDQNYMICWPIAVLYENRTFVGFLMVRSYNQSAELFELCTSSFSARMQNKWGRETEKFSRQTKKGVRARLGVCNNLAFAIHNIHATGKYIFIDLKPQNINVTIHGQIAILDLDSIQIDDKTIRHHAEVSTPDYVPPEGDITKLRHEIFGVTWDYFAMAVIFYQVLFGIHPYTASFSAPFDAKNTISDSIRNGLFVFGSKSNLVTALPAPHQNFTLLEPELRQMFIEAFDLGTIKPHLRPSAERWGKCIFRLLTPAFDTHISAFTKGLPSYNQPPVLSPKVTTQPSYSNTIPPVMAPLPQNTPGPSKSSSGIAWIFVLALFIIVVLTVYYSSH
jgi:DNA-binding helix-hairpin-helix protein with protein kinase domain